MKLNKKVRIDKIIKIDTHGAFIRSKLADTMLRKLRSGAKKAKHIKYIKYIMVDANNGILKSQLAMNITP